MKWYFIFLVLSYAVIFRANNARALAMAMKRAGLFLALVAAAGVFLIFSMAVSSDQMAWTGIFLIIPLMMAAALVIPVFVGVAIRTSSLRFEGRGQTWTALAINLGAPALVSGIVFVPEAINNWSAESLPAACASATHTITVDQTRMRLSVSALAMIDLDQKIPSTLWLERDASVRRLLCSLSQDGMREVRAKRVWFRSVHHGNRKPESCDAERTRADGLCQLAPPRPDMSGRFEELPLEVNVFAFPDAGRLEFRGIKSTYEASLKADDAKRAEVYLRAPSLTPNGEPLTFHCLRPDETSAAEWRRWSCDVAYHWQGDTYVNYRFVVKPSDDVIARGVKIDASFQGFMAALTAGPQP